MTTRRIEHQAQPSELPAGRSRAAADAHAGTRYPGRGSAVAAIVAILAVVTFAMNAFVDEAGGQPATMCDDPGSSWLMCEDFEDGGLGWQEWFARSPWTECLGCSGGVNDPARIRLDEDPAAAHSGSWSLTMPAAESTGYLGASLTYRDCASDKRPGCRLSNHEELYFTAHVRLAEDHQYVHHFLSIAGTQPDRYWDCDGNAGCRPNGYRAAGTTLDFNRDHELFFYTYFPDMRCDRGGYCSGDYAQQICDGCAGKDMPCTSGLECCWGNHFGPEEPVVLETGRWVCLELHQRLNTPGGADGEMSFWVDGELAHRQTGMDWRDVSELGLNKAWLQHYIAAGDADQSNQVWFDDVVVSTERIGCWPETVPTETATAASGTPTPSTPTPGTPTPSMTSSLTPTPSAPTPGTPTPSPAGGIQIYLPIAPP
ncbi:MAG: Dickkopf N-terminal cysteine-rich domain-containing protein [Anaerolineae bacterium]